MAPTSTRKMEKKMEREAREKRIEDALKRIKAGLPVLRAAKQHGIPEATLRRRILSGNKQRQQQNAYHYTTFTAEQEKLLAEHCLKMASLGYGLASWQVSFRVKCSLV